MTEPRLTDHRQVVITDPQGLHLRPAARLAILAKSYRSDICIIARGMTADARSLLGLVMLAAGCGTTLDIVAHGPDAEQAVAALGKLLGETVTHGAAA